MIAARLLQQSSARCTSAARALAQRARLTDAAQPPPKSWWNSAEWWGAAGALAGWGMTGAAIYDATNKGPEVISLTMTPVMMVYSSLFSWWAFVVKPQNLLLCACHASNVVAQSNQLRRAVEHKLENGEGDAVRDLGMKAAAGAVGVGALVAAAPTLQPALAGVGLGALSEFAASPAGPFTVHFWAPMSKWMISGTSFMELDRPTDKISIAQYTALTLTGFFFSRYSLLVSPVNYTLCSVNIALFGSSAWHLGRKVNADYLADDAAAMPSVDDLMALVDRSASLADSPAEIEEASKARPWQL